MEKDQVTLLLNLKLYGLENKDIELEFKKSSLREIDRITFPFLNEQEFIKENEETIFQILQKNKEQYQINIVPTYFELCSPGIYIKTQGDKRIRVLFQTLQVNSSIYLMKDVIKNKMFRGKLSEIYKIDKFIASSNEEYESVFIDCPKYLIKQLELGFFTPKHLESLYCFLLEKKRFFSVVRLLLSNTTIEYDEFTSMIPLREEYNENQLVRKISFDADKNIRLPYKDN